MAQPQFDPNEFAKWIVDGLKETVAYRIKNTFNREKIMEQLQAKVPTQNQMVHFLLKQGFETSGFKFEEINQGDASFYVIRKKNREVEPGHPVRRLIMVPGFGDSPASWLPLYGFLKRDFTKNFDEILILDFPGYMGFLSNQSMVPSMAVIQGFVKTVCEANPPTVLMGHSLGGWLAGKTAQQLHFPIEHLVLLAPSGLTPEDERQSFGDFFCNNHKIPIREFLDLVMHNPKKYYSLISDDIKSFFSKPEIRQFVESVKHHEFIDPNQPFRAKKVSVIWGDHDQMVPSQWMRYWVEHYGPYMDAFLLKNTGHLPQLERPFALAQTIKEALYQRSQSSEGRGWVKIHHRQKEFTAEPLKLVDSRALPEH